MVELSEQKLLARRFTATASLQEVLTDFWFNHFNVDARKGRDRFLLTEYERETIRPRVFGTFPRSAWRPPPRARQCCSISTTG